MAFPVVESQGPASDNATGGAATSGSTAAASHSVVLPATVSAGATLVVVGRVAGVGAVAFPAGWTLVQDSSDASDDVSFWAYKSTAAVGDEDGTGITVTHGTFKMVAHAFSVTGATDPAVTPPQTSTVAVGTGSNPGPTTATPTGGAKDYLWIAVGLADGEHTSPPTTIPASYGGSRGDSTGTGGTAGTNSTAYIATRDLNASSEDAGTWTTSVAVNTGWTSWTIAVHPAPVVAPIPDLNMAPMVYRR